MNKSKIVIYAALALTLLISASVIKGCWKTDPPAGGYQAAPPASAVAGMPKREIKPKKIKALPKEAGKKLGLAPEVADDPDTEIIDTADIDSAEYGATTVTVLDTETGESKTLVKIKPRPFVELLTETSIGVRYGVSTKGGTAADVYAKRDLLRVGSVNLAVYGDVSSDLTEARPEARGMLDLSGRW